MPDLVLWSEGQKPGHAFNFYGDGGICRGRLRGLEGRKDLGCPIQVAAFSRVWRADRQREQQTTGRGTFVPLVFQPGEAFQFDWSEDFAVLGGERTKLQVAHIKLSHSRAFLLRAYPSQTHEMLFDAAWQMFGPKNGQP